MIKFAERLRELRVERHLTQQEMAEFLGMNTRAYQYYEGDDRRPNYEKLVALADFYGLSVDELICHEPKSRPVE